MYKYLTILLTIISLRISGSPIDSIGTKVIDNKKYIIHEITQGETLYRLKVKYDVAVDDIKLANKGLETLAIGQKILIPTNQIVENQITSNDSFHEVQQGETLYKISTMYNVSVEDIKLWNNLSSNSLTVGQKIKISTIENKTPIKNTNSITKRDTTPAITKETIPIPKKKQLKRKIESGSIALSSNDELNYKYHYCLHATAPIGSLIVLTCEINNKTILVKVVGNKTLKGNILLVNKAVFESLNLDENKFTGSITFLN